MLNLIATEQQIEDLVRELLVQPLSQPAFALNVVPADLDDRAVNARGIHNVIIRYLKTEYEDAKAFPGKACVTQVNKVYFQVIVNTNSIRHHRENYSIAEAIIAKLRGKQFLAGVSLQSPAMVTKFEFKDYDSDKACHKSTIHFQSTFTDTYDNR